VTATRKDDLQILRREIQLFEPRALILQPHAQVQEQREHQQYATTQNQNAPRMPGWSVITTLVVGCTVRHTLTDQ
jgi:hypothetical protein